MRKAQPTETVDVHGNKTLDESLSSQLQAELPNLSLFSSKNIQSLKKPVASASSLNKSIDDELDRILNGDLLESDDELDEKNQDLVIKPVPTSTPVKQAAIIKPVTTSRQATGITSVVTSTTVSKTGTVSSQASAKPATTAKQATNVVSKPATTSNQATVPTTASGIKTTAQTSSKTFTSTSQPLTLSPVKPVSRQSLPPLVASAKAPNAVFPSALESVQPLTSTQTGATQQQSLPPPPPPDEYSLKEEPLSELDEDLSISSDDDNDTPLMNSDQLKAALDNMKIVSSDDEDYNKMPEDEYKKRKAEMDKKFDQMRSKPTDPNFVYDKEEDYGKPTMESGWDVDSSSSSSIF